MSRVLACPDDPRFVDDIASALSGAADADREFSSAGPAPKSIASRTPPSRSRRRPNRKVPQ